MQVFSLINDLIEKESSSKKEGLDIYTYAIEPLSMNCGLFGWAENSETIYNLILEYRALKGAPIGQEQSNTFAFAPDYERLYELQKIEAFLIGTSFENKPTEQNSNHNIKKIKFVSQENPSDDLKRLLWINSSSPEFWYIGRLVWMRSLAVMSMVGHVLGIGDRHPSNMLIHRPSNHVIHIDFGDCFEVAMRRETYPEKMPFRLTKMMVRSMEAVASVEGAFKASCNDTMTLLRENRRSILSLLETFLYDPLVEWELGMKNQEKDSLGDNQIQDDCSPMAVFIIDRINSKLKGNDFEPNTFMEVNQQVVKLISQATRERNLCTSYLGWCPFW